MPRIQDDFLECVFYLYPSVPDAESGKSLGGTGFAVSIPTQRPGGEFIYFVTNKHVIEGGSCTVRLNKSDGTVECLDVVEPHWFLSPFDDDLGILR